MTVKRYRNASPELVLAARDLRTGLTPAEERLWGPIRRRQVGGARFRRQQPFAGFVLDFCCPEHRLVVEVDGGVHDDDEQREYDAGRTAHLAAHNDRVIRFRNEEILNDLDAVLHRIHAALTNQPVTTPLGSPLPPAIGGKGGWGG